LRVGDRPPADPVGWKFLEITTGGGVTLTTLQRAATMGGLAVQAEVRVGIAEKPFSPEEHLRNPGGEYSAKVINRFAKESRFSLSPFVLFHDKRLI
jgi:hypothetical protein